MRLHRAAWYEVPEYWPVVSGWVERALSQSLIYRADDLYWGCLSRQMTLWLALEDGPRGMAVTKIETWPRVRLCLVLAVGGEGMDDWLIFAEEIERYARENGCAAVEGWGRRGWQRKLKDYEPTFTVYRKMLSA